MKRLFAPGLSAAIVQFPPRGSVLFSALAHSPNSSPYKWAGGLMCLLFSKADASRILMPALVFTLIWKLPLLSLRCPSRSLQVGRRPDVPASGHT
eukprot:1159484-Pelagomonas_calceolata.AAC.2